MASETREGLYQSPEEAMPGLPPLVSIEARAALHAMQDHWSRTGTLLENAIVKRLGSPEVAFLPLDGFPDGDTWGRAIVAASKHRSADLTMITMYAEEVQNQGGSVTDLLHEFREAMAYVPDLSLRDFAPDAVQRAAHLLVVMEVGMVLYRVPIREETGGSERSPFTWRRLAYEEAGWINLTDAKAEALGLCATAIRLGDER